MNYHTPSLQVTGAKQDATVKALRKFFKVNGFNPVLDTKTRSKNAGTRAATKDEIRKVLAYSITNPRNQAIIAALKDSGLRPSDLLQLKIKEIKLILDDPGLEWLIFRLPVQKTSRQGKVALPTFGPDTVKYLRLWLNEREKLGLSNENPEAFVFVNIREVSDFTTENGEYRDSSALGDPLDAKVLSSNLCALCARVDLPELNLTLLRRYQTSRLSVAGVPQDIVKFVQGKHQGSSIESYLDLRSKEILPIYHDAYHELILDVEAAKYIESDRILELEARLEKLSRQYEELIDAYLAESQIADERLEDLKLIAETYKELKESGIDVKEVIMEAVRKKSS